ncbi:TonB-dependent siderophore receptor [Leeia sp. TBRC 13508]|uniref:TonB-dependent siderophore receptor n=1 Tax=Leeia speluncae TaxID=2884804 RepID=A0ABS8D681_9NEIS|nr:TonB-dependent siderophore receptor [Leeia speluncae]MCB6183713.1 TonB-dependent siderophore receptor [Leeia speluncae]
MPKKANRKPQRPSETAALLLPLGAMMVLSAPLMASAEEASEVTTMPTIKVQQTKELENEGYVAKKTSIGKLVQDPKEIPQSLTIVTEQKMDDRNADTLKEALRDVAGLTFNAGEGGRIGDNMTLRGYSVVGDLYLDGIRDSAQYNREVFNLEQVDVLRGSASMLFGRGSTGGVINQESKTPKLLDEYKTSVTIGDNNYKRVTADINKQLGETTALRFNAMKTDTDSFANEVSNSREGWAGSIGFGIGTPDEVNVSHYHLETDNVPFFGVPYLNGAPMEVPLNTFYGLAAIDYERDNTDISTVSWKHKFSPTTQLKTTFRHSEYWRDLSATAPRLSGTSTITRQNQARGGEVTNDTFQADLSTTINTGSWNHEILTGMELARETSNTWSHTYGASRPSTTVYDPNPYPTLSASFYNRTTASTGNYKGNTSAFYAQDMIQFAPEWKWLVGARFDQLKAYYNNITTSNQYTRKDRMWSYRTGIIFEPDDTASYYASYGSSFNPSADLYTFDARGSNTPPEESRNIEIGAKWDLLDGDLSLRTSLSRTEKYNERNTDVDTAATQYLLSGKRHTDAFEVEVSGKPWKNWELTASWALMKAKVDSDPGTNSTAQGKRPTNTPSHTASIWGTYDFGEGWKAGLGVERVGARYANTSNTTRVPGYTRFDGLVSYELNKNVKFSLNVFNLANTRYYEGVYTGHVVPGTPRTWQLTADFKF